MPQPRTTRTPFGAGQLSLVEHSLCPLDARKSLTENSVHSSGYEFTDSQGQRCAARARVFSPLGMSAADELYLWGMLAITLRSPDPQPELFATPHWLLGQLGLIEPTGSRGGRQYQQFRDALRRLSVTSYMNDAFYDPVRAEHRQVSFNFLNYSLPVDSKSSRAWQIEWSPAFFQLAVATGGYLHFDLELYRQLDPATRRLFLFVSKVLNRRNELRAVSFEQLVINTMGFSPSVPRRVLKDKLKRCLVKLTDAHVLSESAIKKSSSGNLFVSMTRGEFFTRKAKRLRRLRPEETAVFETLLSIGFDRQAADRLVGRFEDKPKLLSEWCDITQAATERFGNSFFTSSPMAFLVDSVDKASKGNRTAPDWWREARRAEISNQEVTAEGRQVLANLHAELFGNESVVASATTGDGRLTSAAQILTRIK